MKSRVALLKSALVHGAILLACTGASAAQSAVCTEALLGEWQYDASKSTFIGDNPYSSGKTTFQNTRQGLHLLAEIILGGGSLLRFEYHDPVDGNFVPVTGNPFYDSESTICTDELTAVRTERRAGKTTGVTTFKVAADGQSYSASAGRTLPNGGTYISVIVWKRSKK